MKKDPIIYWWRVNQRARFSSMTWVWAEIAYTPSSSPSHSRSYNHFITPGFPAKLIVTQLLRIPRTLKDHIDLMVILHHGRITHTHTHTHTRECVCVGTREGEIERLITVVITVIGQWSWSFDDVLCPSEEHNLHCFNYQISCGIYLNVIDYFSIPPPIIL